MEVAKNIIVEDSELKFSFARSGGPGGQHVNKTSSKVILHWKIADSPGVSAAMKARFRKQYRTRINDEGELVIDSDESRSQHRNREIVIEKLKEMLLAVAKPPKRRIPTKPSKAARKKRRVKREQHSKKKQLRKKVDY